MVKKGRKAGDPENGGGGESDEEVECEAKKGGFPAKLEGCRTEGSAGHGLKDLDGSDAHKSPCHKGLGNVEGAAGESGPEDGWSGVAGRECHGRIMASGSGSG